MPLLFGDGHVVVGSTRTAGKTAALETLGAKPVVVDVFDAAALPRRPPARGVRALEKATPGIDGIVLRYGRLYGPGTWFNESQGSGSLHVDAAAHAALLAVTRGNAGVYNICDDDGAVVIAKARAALGFDPSFRSGT